MNKVIRKIERSNDGRNKTTSKRSKKMKKKTLKGIRYKENEEEHPNAINRGIGKIEL